MTPFFFYGTLRYAPLRDLVLGRQSDPSAVPASLAGHAVCWAVGECFPLLVAAPEATAQGVLIGGLTEADLARLDFYEGGFAYHQAAVTVATSEGPCLASVFLPEPGLWRAGAAWDLVEWETLWGDITLRAAAEVMGYFGQIAAQSVASSFPTIRQRAAAWVRAQAAATPVSVRRPLAASDVTVKASRRPYTKYFMLEERDVRFRHFDGSYSAEVERAALVSGDAVTVLPYDPTRDRVLLVEQFRFGPFVRGDRNPWSLEPIAGRIDAGETPPQAARREAIEEAGLTLHEIELIAQYYPSPAALSEYLFSYVAIADLPDAAAGIGGLAGEAEDIRSIVLSFDALMALLQTGEAENGPLILSALWLARHRDRLRRSA